MIRWLFLVLLAPLWLPVRLVRWARYRWGSRAVLHLKLSGVLPDLPVPAGLLGLLRRAPAVHLLSVLDALRRAEDDPKLETLLVRIDDLQCGLGRADEVRAALARVRQRGKRVIVHADELGLAGYWIALAASDIRLSPPGSLHVSGVAMEFTLLKGLLDRTGVRAQLLAQGKYKSLRETFSAEAISEANREMMASLVSDLTEQLLKRVADRQQLTLEAARALVDQGPFRAEQARALGLVDQLQYWDELYAELGGGTGRVQRLDAYRKRQRGRWLLPRRPSRVALVSIAGSIRSGHDRPGPHGPRATGHHSLRRALRRCTSSRRVRAIVVRVDSPGGSALASDLMWRELQLAAEKKPMFVSMANMAASGGYYTSGIKGVRIWANPTTLTGSIGVVGGKLEVSELLSRLGVARATVASGPRANFYSVTTPWSSEELAKLERDLEASYRDFVSKMAEVRGLPYEALEAVAQGRVWTGNQALGIRLVDHVGGLAEVEREVRQQLGLSPDAPLAWSAPASPSGPFGARGARGEEAMRWPLALRKGAPELAELFERAADLGGERLLALSVVQLRSPR